MLNQILISIHHSYVILFDVFFLVREKRRLGRLVSTGNQWVICGILILCSIPTRPKSIKASPEPKTSEGQVAPSGHIHSQTIVQTSVLNLLDACETQFFWALSMVLVGEVLFEVGVLFKTYLF